MGLHDLDGHLVSGEVHELDLAKLLLELLGDGGDLTQQHDLLKQLLEVDGLSALDKLILY